MLMNKIVCAQQHARHRGYKGKKAMVSTIEILSLKGETEIYINNVRENGRNSEGGKEKPGVKVSKWYPYPDHSWCSINADSK